MNEKHGAAVSLRLLSTLDLDAMTEIHLKAFPESFLTQTGHEAVKRYYSWILTGPHDIYAAGIYEDGALSAYAVGGTFRGAVSGYLRQNFIFLFFSVLVRPALWVNKRLFRKAAESFRLLGLIRIKKTTAAGEAGDSFGVSVIAVDPSRQNQGFGKRLMKELETAALKRKFNKMDLTVNPRNQKAVSFYLNFGWNKVSDAGEWTGKMEKTGLVSSAETQIPEAAGKDSEWPRVTVIMAVRNETRFIRKTLDAVLSQSYPPRQMEIFISDGLSEDGTLDILKEYARADSRIVILENPGKIVSTGLNLAITESTGEILVRVDGHTVIAPDYVEKCVTGLLTSSADSIGGRMHASGEDGFPKAVAFATSTPLGVGNARFHYSNRQEWADTVYLGAWRRDVFQKVGLFDETFVRNQDDEFHYRIRARGGRILLSPAVKSSYQVRSNWKALASQYFQYGFWKVRVFQKHPAQMQARHFVPVTLVLSLLGAAFCSVLAFGSYVFFLAVLFYLAGVFIAALLSCRSYSLKFTLTVFVIYATLHLSYGTGFLFGLFRFLLFQDFRTLNHPPAYKAG